MRPWALVRATEASRRRSPNTVKIISEVWFHEAARIELPASEIAKAFVVVAAASRMAADWAASVWFDV